MHAFSRRVFLEGSHFYLLHTITNSGFGLAKFAQTYNYMRTENICKQLFLYTNSSTIMFCLIASNCTSLGRSKHKSAAPTAPPIQSVSGLLRPAMISPLGASTFALLVQHSVQLGPPQITGLPQESHMSWAMPCFCNDSEESLQRNASRGSYKPTCCGIHH